MASLLTYPAVPTEDGINQYFNQVWQFPVLEKEQEQMLAIRFRERGDTLAAHKLVTSHLRLVVKIAMTELTANMVITIFSTAFLERNSL